MNKKISIVIIIIVILLIGFGMFGYFTFQDKQTTLTALEKQWIDNNKNKLIDLDIPSQTPVLSMNGEGIIFDFLSDIEKDTGLEFNKLPYLVGEKTKNDYAIEVVDKKNKDDILIYSDNYALVSLAKINYNDVSDIKNIVVGVLNGDMAKINKYLTGSSDVTYKSYDNTELMIADLKVSKIDTMAIPKLAYLNEIIEDEKLNIVYNITEYSQNYVLKLGNIEKLNKILTKYFKKWNAENFENSFNKYLIENYFEIKGIDEKQQVEFRSKRYNYGFVQNGPFDKTTKDGLRGINYSFINSFSKATNIEFNYKKYSSFDSMITEFDENKLDIVFNYYYKSDYNMDIYNTIPIIKSQVAVITDQNTDVVVNSVNSLSGYTVFTVKNSKIDKYLNDQGVKTKTFNNCQTLVNRIGKKDIAVVDYYIYDYYVRDGLEKFTSLDTFNLEDNYGYVSRNISANKTFNELFDFYLSFTDTKKVINDSYKNLLDYNDSNKFLQFLLLSFGSILLVLLGIITGKYIRRRRKYHTKLSKAEKLRYIDTLTSLKNRNYLNDNIEKWDSSEIYPQAVIVVDLNNIAYINDNFGHAEGDKIIVEAAGILIANQLPNSEIIRTNGNEFLVFMVGHDEKAIVTYIRKLNKEFKGISHGFGAALGYSMINDEIKTFDDAVNEATLDMRSNKEER